MTGLIENSKKISYFVANGYDIIDECVNFLTAIKCKVLFNVHYQNGVLKC